MGIVGGDHILTMAAVMLLIMRNYVNGIGALLVVSSKFKKKMLVKSCQTKIMVIGFRSILPGVEKYSGG